MNESSDKKIEISDMSVDELMEVAKKRLSKPIKKKTKNKSISERSDIIKEFILAENVKSHTSIKVPSILVYDKYHKWATLENDHKLLTIVAFNKEFGKIFKAVTLSKNKYYLLHPEGFNLSDEHHASLKEKYTNFKKKS